MNCSRLNKKRIHSMIKQDSQSFKESYYPDQKDKRVKMEVLTIKNEDIN